MSPPRACRRASAGIMVAKMPAKSTATSTMGAQLKWLDARGPRGPSSEREDGKDDQDDLADEGEVDGVACAARGPENSTATITSTSRARLIEPLRRMGT